MKTPFEYVQEIETLTEEYAKLTEAYADCIAYQADYYHQHRQDYKSDTAVQRAFDRTEKGIEMQIIKAKIKSKEKRISASKTALRLLENQAKNLF